MCSRALAWRASTFCLNAAAGMGKLAWPPCLPCARAGRAKSESERARAADVIRERIETSLLLEALRVRRMPDRREVPGFDAALYPSLQSSSLVVPRCTTEGESVASSG